MFCGVAAAKATVKALSTVASTRAISSCIVVMVQSMTARSAAVGSTYAARVSPLCRPIILATAPKKATTKSTVPSKTRQGTCDVVVVAVVVYVVVVVVPVVYVV